MKIRASDPVQALTPGLESTLAHWRTWRHFDPAAWVEAKVVVVNDYFASHRLSGAVMGVSGGLDSAVVAALLARAMRQPNSSLRRLELLALPAFDTEGVTGQVGATDRAQALAAHLDLPLSTINLATPAAQVREDLGASLAIRPTAWAAGQGIAVARTLALYQAAALLSQAGHPALVVGTINRDEGAYLGYVGKASDGMVDLQVISDLHKSEVRSVARYLSLPDLFLDVEPTGDMFDACPDTDVFGAPYDAVELLLHSQTLGSPAWRNQAISSWNRADRDTWEKMRSNLQQLHGYNAHKYLVGSPAVHLDLMDSAMPGGWSPSRPEPFRFPSSVVSHRPAPRTLPSGDRRDWVNPCPPMAPVSDSDGLRLHWPGLLSSAGVSTLANALSSQPWQQADEHGVWRQGKVSSAPVGAPGSWRTTFEDSALAAVLWETLHLVLPSFRRGSLRSRFDASGASVWRPIGVNPVFRAIAYAQGGSLVAHYDGAFEVDARRRTGMTLVIYLDLEGEGGLLRFLRDPQSDLPFQACDWSDWPRLANPDEVDIAVAPSPGDAWLFDHHMLHDSTPIISGRKLLLRTDIVFEKVGP